MGIVFNPFDLQRQRQQGETAGIFMELLKSLALQKMTQSMEERQLELQARRLENDDKRLDLLGNLYESREMLAGERARNLQDQQNQRALQTGGMLAGDLLSRSDEEIKRYAPTYADQFRREHPQFADAMPDTSGLEDPAKLGQFKAQLSALHSRIKQPSDRYSGQLVPNYDQEGNPVGYGVLDKTSGQVNPVGGGFMPPPRAGAGVKPDFNPAQAMQSQRAIQAQRYKIQQGLMDPLSGQQRQPNPDEQAMLMDLEKQEQVVRRYLPSVSPSSPSAAGSSRGGFQPPGGVTRIRSKTNPNDIKTWNYSTGEYE